jgi:signal transduction histidine kinase
MDGSADSAEGSPLGTARPVELGDVSVERLLHEAVTRVRSARDEQARWRVLLDAVIEMAGDVSREELLGHIVKVASELIGARYVALGVLSSTPDKRWRALVTHGSSEAQWAVVGDLPHGEGVLEVPITTRGKPFGMLCLTEKQGTADFTDTDERMMVALATAAGVVLESARLHEEAVRRQRWLDATAQITTRLTGDIAEDESLQLIADQARQVAGADFAWIVTGPHAKQLSLRAMSGMEIDPARLRAVPVSSTISGRVVRTGRPLLVDNLAEEPGALDFGVVPISALGPLIVFPLHDVDQPSDIGVEGVLALAWRHENADAAQDLDPDLPAAFAKQVALALRVARGRREQQQLAVYADRDRIARDLHDVVIQRLFSIGLSLQTIYRRSKDPELAERLDVAAEDIDDTIREIRRTIFELGTIEQADDLMSEMRRMVDRAAASLKFRPELVFEGPVRLGVPPAVQPDLIAVLAEALSNCVRHSGATEVSVRLQVAHEVTLRVSDNGSGIARDAVHSGLRNMRQRAQKHGGRCQVTKTSPHGTLIEWAVPLRATRG